MISPAFLLNALLDIWVGGRRRPVFFDIETTAPALRLLDAEYSAIRAEFDALLQERIEIPKFHEVDPFEYRISGRGPKDRHWRVFMLYAMGEKPASNRARCPNTVAVLDRIPDLFQAFFSILDPGKSIPAHCGPYRGYLRYHLGLKVPVVNPPRIKVNGCWYQWREGESVLFDDSWSHEVENRSDDLRGVLIVDVLRPLPSTARQINLIAQKLIRAVYARRVLRLE